jgi:hypothetical protein
VKLPSTEQLQHVKVLLEVLLLLLLVPVVLYTLAKDRQAGIQMALGAKS